MRSHIPDREKFSRIPMDCLWGLMCGLLAATLVFANSTGPSVGFIARWGGISKEIPSALVSHGSDLFVVGSTYSRDFPTTAGRAANGNWCVFGTRLNATNGGVIYSATTCGRGMTWGRSAAVSPSGELWTVGSTGWHGFPVTATAAQRDFGGASSAGTGDAFVLRWTKDGSSLAYSTYLGGAGDEQATAVLSDAAGGAWIGGSTTSRGFGVASTPRSDPQAFAPFVAYLGSGGRLESLDQLEGLGNHAISTMVWSGRDRIVLAGGGGVAPFDIERRSVVWRRNVGWNSNDYLLGATVLGDGRIVLVGESDSPRCRRNRKQDGWVVILSKDGALLKNRCAGGSENDSSRSVAMDVDGQLWITVSPTRQIFHGSDRSPKRVRSPIIVRRFWRASIFSATRSRLRCCWERTNTPESVLRGTCGHRA